MGAGQSVNDEMQQGVLKSTVVVIFLSDAYCSSKCKKHHLGHQPIMSIAVSLWLLLPRRTIEPSCSSSLSLVPSLLKCAHKQNWKLQQAGGSSAEMSR